MSITIPESAPAKPATGGFGELEQRGLEYLKALRSERPIAHSLLGKLGETLVLKVSPWPMWSRKGKLLQLSRAYLKAHTEDELTRDFPAMYDALLIDQNVFSGIGYYSAGLDIRKELPEPVRLILSRARDALARAIPELRGRGVGEASESDNGSVIQQMKALHDSYLKIVQRGYGDPSREIENEYFSLHEIIPTSFPGAYDALALDADVVPRMMQRPARESHKRWQLWSITLILGKVREALHHHSSEFLDYEAEWRDIAGGLSGEVIGYPEDLGG